MTSSTKFLPLPAQLKAARALLNIPYLFVADSLGISPNTVKNCEDGKTRRRQTILSVQHAYEQLGIEFIEPTARRGAGIRLKSPKMHKKPSARVCDTVSEQQAKLKAQMQKLGII